MDIPAEERKFLEYNDGMMSNSNEETTTSSPDYSTVESASLKPKVERDRGYAWVVLTASFMCQVIGVGSALSNGAFTPTLLEKYGEDREAVAWIGSLHAGLVFFAGPVAGMLTDRFEHRPVIICGALLASTGALLSAFATELWMLYITYGVMGGVGICFTYIPSVTVLANYFVRWRHVAFAASAAGTGIGTLMMPQFLQLLLQEYGPQSAYILLAAVMLQMVICGALIRPQSAEAVGQPKHKITLKEELAILADWRFDLFIINNYLFNFGSLILFVFISDYAMVRGTTSAEGMSLISIVGISNAVGRVFNTLLSLCKIVNRTPIYLVTCSLSGVSICLLTIGSSVARPFLLLATFCALYGSLFGIQLGNLAIVTNRLAGMERLNTAYGIVMMLDGIGAATGPPCAGFLYKVSGSYELAFYVGGGATILAGLIMIPIIIKSNSQQQIIDFVRPDIDKQPVDKNVGGLTIPDIQNMGSRIIASLNRLNETESEQNRNEMKELCAKA